ncbi:helix-turn-helix domain-containing protein [Paenibacillus sp. 598K]|uniref:helix-turn-helix domain-containing protein n=1 Tax=Paenibacillus sp. 598K TaxID=1117987 RepID=UPI000FFE4D36|nr:helix-turn-helix domain-containing protein [Paenibacillus sp. 598K]
MTRYPFKHLRRLRQHRWFFRFIIPYCFFMLLTLLLGYLLYDRTYEVVENEVTSANLQLLDQVRDTLDRRISEIDSIAFQIMNDPQITGFQRIDKPFEGANTYRVLETQQRLYSYNVSNNFIVDYFLFFKNSGLVLSPKTTYEMPRFYNQMLRYDGTDYDAWREELFDRYYNREFQPVRQVTYQGKPRTMMTYMQSMGYPNRVNGAIAILVDNRQLLSSLQGVDLSQGGWASIRDREGRVISSISHDATGPEGMAELPARRGILKPSEATDGMMISYTTSADTGWSYVVAQPPHVVLEKVLYIKKITFGLVGLFLFVGLLLAGWLAYRNSRPLLGIIKTLNERVSGQAQRPGDVYGFIHQAVSGLIDNNRQLESEMEKQAPLVWDTFFERLLKGEFVTLQQINTLLSHQRVDLRGTSYAIGIIRLRGGGREAGEERLRHLDLERVLVKEALRDLLGDEGYDHDIAEDRIALLLVNRGSIAESFQSRIASLIERLHERMEGVLSERISVALGSTYGSLMEVSSSYEEARQALFHTEMHSSRKVIWFEELPYESSGYYFPGEIEVRLMNYTKAGERDELARLLEGIREENFIRRHLPLSMQQLFLCEVAGCLVKIHDQLQAEQPEAVRTLFQQLTSTTDPHVLYKALAERFAELCHTLDQRKKSRNYELVDIMVESLNKRYKEPDLNLDKLADELGMSKVYLSQFFKEQTGANFSDYLVQLRMRRAKELLVGTSQPINRIAELAGYYSSNTFCRAFKRETGLSATAYRNLETGNQV